jgi:hypothetical protein
VDTPVDTPVASAAATGRIVCGPRSTARRGSNRRSFIDDPLSFLL